MVIHFPNVTHLVSGGAKIYLGLLTPDPMLLRSLNILVTVRFYNRPTLNLRGSANKIQVKSSAGKCGLPRSTELEDQTVQLEPLPYDRKV